MCVRNPQQPCKSFGWSDGSDADELRASLQELLHRARGGELVEIGYLGGHGRTGTALACLAVLTGTPPDQAVDWVRANYCPEAIEPQDQSMLVETFGVSLRHRTAAQAK